MKQWWQSLEQRERMFVGGLGVFLAVFLFYMLLLEPLFAGAAEYREKVAVAEGDLAFMQSAAPQLMAMGPRTNEPVSRGPITLVVDRTLGNHGITTEKMQAVGEDGLRVQLDDTSFDAIVECLGELSARHGIGIESANLREGDMTGTTNATLTLRSQQ